MIPIDSDTFLTLTAAFKYVVSNPDQFAKQGSRCFRTYTSSSHIWNSVYFSVEITYYAIKE